MARHRTIATSFLLVSLLFSSAAIAAPLVILDPGHGGEDTGASRSINGKTVFEKDLTLELALETSRWLSGHGIKTVLTRKSDVAVSLDVRTDIANRAALQNDAVFISIHANASGNEENSGVETFVFKATTNQASKRLANLENGKRFSQSRGTLALILSDLATTANYGASRRLAQAVQNSAVEILSETNRPARNRGIRQALFYVLMQTHMPAILFEPGFLSNPDELATLLSPEYRLALARALGLGVLAWDENRKTPFLAGRHKAHAISGIRKR